MDHVNSLMATLLITSKSHHSFQSTSKRPPQSVQVQRSEKASLLTLPAELLEAIMIDVITIGHTGLPYDPCYIYRNMSGVCSAIQRVYERVLYEITQWVRLTVPRGWLLGSTFPSITDYPLNHKIKQKINPVIHIIANKYYAGHRTYSESITDVYIPLFDHHFIYLIADLAADALPNTIPQHLKITLSNLTRHKRHLFSLVNSVKIIAGMRNCTIDIHGDLPKNSFRRGAISFRRLQPFDLSEEGVFGYLDTFIKYMADYTQTKKTVTLGSNKWSTLMKINIAGLNAAITTCDATTHLRDLQATRRFRYLKFGIELLRLQFLNAFMFERIDTRVLGDELWDDNWRYRVEWFITNRLQLDPILTEEEKCMLHLCVAEFYIAMFLAEQKVATRNSSSGRSLNFFLPCPCPEDTGKNVLELKEAQIYYLLQAESNLFFAAHQQSNKEPLLLLQWVQRNIALLIPFRHPRYIELFTTHDGTLRHHWIGDQRLIDQWNMYGLLNRFRDNWPLNIHRDGDDMKAFWELFSNRLPALRVLGLDKTESFRKEKIEVIFERVMKGFDYRVVKYTPKFVAIGRWGWGVDPDTSNDPDLAELEMVIHPELNEDQDFPADVDIWDDEIEEIVSRGGWKMGRESIKFWCRFLGYRKRL